MSSTDFLAAHAAAIGDKPALIGVEGTVTFAELDRRANQVANAFAGLGVLAGDRVATLSHNSTRGYEVGHGLRRLMAVGVPINYRLRGSELAYVLNDSGAKLVIAGPQLVGVAEEVRAQVTGDRVFLARGEAAPPGWLAYEELVAAQPDTSPEIADANQLGASMIYTSGTTGNPKGAYRPAGVDVATVLLSVQAFELTQADVHLVAGPGYHSAVGYFSALTQLLGGTNVVMPKFDPEQALALIERHRVSTTFMAPTLVQRMVDLPARVRERYDVGSMRAIIMGAAPCPQVLKEEAIAYFGEVLWEFYGATETGIQTVLRPPDQLRKPGSCGTAMAGHEILLLDEEGVEVPVGTPGVLWVRNNSLAEYYNNPEATSRNMRDGYFTVGDVAFRDEEGYYYICDRLIDMIISGGVNIYPAEIEAVLHAHPAVLDAAVIGVPDAHWGEQVKAVVQLQPGANAGPEDLIGFCRARLADYKCPRSVDFVAELPREPAGKLLKRTIREPYWEGSGRRI